MSESNEVQEGVMSEDDVIVRIKDLHKSYGDLEVLRGIDIDVHRGEVVVVLGPSGSGKTTLMNMIGCMDDGQWGILSGWHGNPQDQGGRSDHGTQPEDRVHFPELSADPDL